jgi:hypothetical protein
MKRLFLASLLLLGFYYSHAGTDGDVVDRMKYHIYYMSDDSLQGRLTGTEGEAMAYRYISSVFENYGVEPYFEDGSFLHPFDFGMGKEYGEENFLKIDGEELILGEEFHVLPSSANGEAAGSLVDVGSGLIVEGKRDDYAKLKKLNGKVFLMDYHFPEFDNPHSDNSIAGDLKSRIELAAEKGAVAVVLYAGDADFDKPGTSLRRNVQDWPIPVVFIDKIEPKLLIEQNPTVSLRVELNKITSTGHNVVGRIFNGAEHDIVIGAHYDHLGYGEAGGSLYRGEPAIHNGADDNASGVAMMLELAKAFKELGLDKYNFTFIAFSGEELGLYGSKSWVKRQGFESESIQAMINMDMVGRLDTSTNKLSVNGTGTSPEFEEALKELAPNPIEPVFSSSGSGPSDHMSFYLEDIPVIHFFSGTHEDYHKPSDDALKINFEGTGQIYTYVLDFVKWLNEEEKLAFTATQDEDEGKKAAQFKVTLGVVPDYMHQDRGMRIDGVSDDRPAQKAGLQKGDIIIGIGDMEIGDIYDYMEGLSKYKSGDSTNVKVIREGEELDFEVTF